MIARPGGRLLVVTGMSGAGRSTALKTFEDMHPGQQLRIPIYYAKMSEFWIDKATLLISHIRDTDFNGKVYEEYWHTKMVDGPAAGLTDKDFDPNNPDLGF